MPLTTKNKSFIYDIINGMSDWVRVIDRDNNMVYVNKSMSEALGCDLVGKKCYTALGKKAPCENCISRKAVFEGITHEKEEEVNGRIYHVMSSPISDESGEIVAAVEVLRDVTQMKYLQKQLEEQNKKLSDDLTLARKLQMSLLPKKAPSESINFSYKYIPCDSLGGDFFDIFKIDDNNIGVYIADVSGHGVSASMLTVFLRSALNKKLLSPAAALNELFKEYNSDGFNYDLYITVFYAILDMKDKTLKYSNAGHNVSPIIYNKERFEILRSAGIPISDWLESSNYKDNLIPLYEGDRIFFSTDGIIELKNNNEEQFGEKRLLDILLNESSTSENVLYRIFEAASKFAGEERWQNPIDDITMALLEIKKGTD